MQFDLNFIGYSKSAVFKYRFISNKFNFCTNYIVPLMPREYTCNSIIYYYSMIILIQKKFAYIPFSDTRDKKSTRK